MGEIDLMGFLAIQLFGVTLSLAGIFLNIFKNRLCWIFYFVANLFWMGFYIYTKFWPVAVLMLVYTGLAVWGWLRWGKDDGNQKGD